MSKIILNVMMVVAICCLIVTACRKDQNLDPQEAINLPQGKIAKQFDVKDQTRGGNVSFEVRADDPAILEWFDNECLTVQFGVPDDATDSEEAHEDLPASSMDKPTEFGQRFVSIRMSGIFAQDAATLEYYGSESKNYSVKFSPELVERLRANQISVIIEFEDVKLASTDRHCENRCWLSYRKRVKLYGDNGQIETGVALYWAYTGNSSVAYLMWTHYFLNSKMCDVCDHGLPNSRYLRAILTVQDVLTGYTPYNACN